MAGLMASNDSSLSHAAALPPLPSYSLEPAPDLLPSVSNLWLPIVVPVLAYWIMSLAFHFLDVYDVFPQYRLHTPDEITRRNHVSRYQVARDVVIQQMVQGAFAAFLAVSEPPEMVGRQDYDIAVWARRLRLAQRVLPSLLRLLGLNAAAVSKSVAASYPLLAAALAGGHYPFLAADGVASASSAGHAGPVPPAFAPWELAVARVIYHVAVPALQFFVAIFMLDTWQYFWHRAMHMNQWMYTHFHSRHHRLYVPYAYGALYNHPVEGFILDTLGAALAFKLTGMTLLQGTCYFTISTIKTVDDHCGYHFPWDPLQLITSNNAAYHDIHHQTWGIKSNFAQPFFTFWDSFLDTKYKGPRTDRLADKERRIKAAAK